MADSTKASVLARKVAPGAVRAGAAQSEWSRVWQAVAPRVADEVVGVDLVATRCEERRAPLEAVLDGLPATGLLVRLEGVDGVEGFAHLDCALLTSVIEAETLGRVLPNPPQERMGTRTDAAVVAPLIDQLFGAAEDEVRARIMGEPPWKGLRYRGHYADRRAVALRLEDGVYTVSEIDLDFASGTRTCRLQIAARAPSSEIVTEAETSEADPLESVMSAKARLSVVLDRRKMPLSWVRDLSVDTVLPMSRESLAAVRVETMDGRLVGIAQLGQEGGQRAVRLKMASMGTDALPGSAPKGPDLPTAWDGSVHPGNLLEATSVPALPDASPTGPAGHDLPAQPHTGVVASDDRNDDQAGTPTPDLPDLPDLPELPPEL